MSRRIWIADFRLIHTILFLFLYFQLFVWNEISLYIYIYIYILRLKIKPNSVIIRSLSWQCFVLPSTGFELTPLIHGTTNRLALCPAPLTTRSLDHIRYLKYSCNSQSVTFSRKVDRHKNITFNVGLNLYMTDMDMMNTIQMHALNRGHSYEKIEDAKGVIRSDE